MSKRKLGAATALEVPGLYRVTWSADIQAASHDDAAALARAMQLRKGPAATALAGDDGKIADWSMKDIKESVGHARDRHRDGMAILARCQPCS